MKISTSKKYINKLFWKYVYGTEHCQDIHGLQIQFELSPFVYENYICDLVQFYAHII